MNYFYYTKKPFSKTYIGSCNFGWAFLLMVEQVPDLIAWKEKFKTPGSYIVNEEGCSVSSHDMEMIITVRHRMDPVNENPSSFNGRIFVGTHNLLHIIVGETILNYTCIGNEDSWDLCRRR